MSREIKATSKTESSTSFDGKHVLEFSETSHRYKLDGKACPGVTTVNKSSYPTSEGLINWKMDQAVMFAITAPDELDGLDLIKEARQAWKAPSQEAADIGTVTHAYAELHSLGQHDQAEWLLQKVSTASKFAIIESCVNKYLDWSIQNQGELIKAEGLIASPTHLYCGKFDRLDKVNGKIRIRDYKTSKDIYLDQFIQLGAYAIAIKEWLGLDVEELEVLRFGKDDGSFQPLLINDPAEVEIFKEQAIRCRKTFEFTKLNNDPRFDWKKK